MLLNEYYIIFSIKAHFNRREMYKYTTDNMMNSI